MLWNYFFMYTSYQLVVFLGFTRDPPYERDCYEKGVSPFESQTTGPQTHHFRCHRPRKHHVKRVASLKRAFHWNIPSTLGWDENCGHFSNGKFHQMGWRMRRWQHFFETKWFCFGWGMLLTNHQTDSLGSTWSGSRTKTQPLLWASQAF